MHINNFTETDIQKFSGQRRKMIEEHLIRRGIKDLAVAEAMSRIPRHLFVQESFQHQAYGDHPLPIGGNQTISQPYVVGLMTEALHLTGKERVLEIGTGSGYQTAVLAELAEQVFTIERIKSIGMAAQKRLTQLGYTNIIYKVFDGTYGWRDQGPYDAILVAASAPDIPAALIEQLKDTGRLVAPIGEKNDQNLVLLSKNGSKTTRKSLGNCTFVPLIGKFGWTEDQ